MPDIAMCLNFNCPFAKKCHRFTAKPNQRSQSYFSPEIKEGENKCDYFWSNENLDDDVDSNYNYLINKNNNKVVCK